MSMGLCFGMIDGSVERLHFFLCRLYEKTRRIFFHSGRLGVDGNHRQVSEYPRLACIIVRMRMYLEPVSKYYSILYGNDGG